MSIVLIAAANGQNKAWIGISPGGAHEVNGVMINLFPDIEENKELTIIKGLELELSPAVPLILGITLVPVALGDHSWRNETNNLETIKEISGAHIGLINLEPTKIDGLEINAINLNSNCSGLSIAGLNILDEINGISIGLLRNYSSKCDGLQVGLINESPNLKGFQFGLWNKNQKRSLPFINWNFSEDENES